MAGFYGNITNISRTQFQFDKIYPSRYEMDRNLITDNIYFGKYVLIEYDGNGLDGYKEVQIKNDQLYYNPIGPTGVTTLLTDTNSAINQIVYVTLTNAATKVQYHSFYKITGFKDRIATYEQILRSDDGNAYTANYNIDLLKYGAGRGYDSTVWQKVYSDNGEKYVMIAELNTVVPKFNVIPDAPTMSPIVPHFDTKSTDVYYKLHWQAPWGLRLAAATGKDESDKDIQNTYNGLSDAKTTWTKREYNQDTGATIIKYFDPEEYEWTSTAKKNNIDAAIYFNKAGFNEAVKNKVSGATDNYIIIKPTGKSGAKYNDHNTASTMSEQVDTQELTINLPAIGNMMSDAWDIIHGPDRDDSRTGDRHSLKGRLDSFDAFYGNQIPVKRASDGTIIGSKINGAIPYDEKIDLLQLPEGADGTVSGFDGDDAWIETVINTIGLKGGDKNTNNDQASNSGISIHHTFHATDNSASAVDKNTGKTSETNKYKENHIRSTNKDHNTDDVIDLYVPYVDAKGHVVGHNIETVTLPYGFKTITVGAESNEATGIAAAAGDVVADNTQDTLTMAPGNKWIHLTAGAGTDTITVSHEVDDNTTTLANIEYGLSQNESIASLDTDNRFEVPCFTFDEAGHILNAATHTVTLPENYTKFKTIISDVNNIDSITGTAGTIKPSSLDDELVFTEGNRWINIVPTTDTLTISHYVKDFKETSNGKTDFNTDTTATRNNTFTVQEFEWDRAGHITVSDIHTYTMPDSFKNINIKNAGSSMVASTSATNATLIADNLVDTVEFDTGNRWIVLTGSANEDKVIFSHGQPNTAATGTTYTTAEMPDFGATFTIPEVKYDETGHIHNVSTHTVTMPKGSLEDEKVTTATAKVLTNIGFDVTSGKISIEHDNAANLKLTDLKPINANAAWVQATDDIKSAFNKIDTRLDNEIARATDVETILGNYINSLDYTDTSTTQFIASIAQENGKIAVIRADAGTLVLGTASDNGMISANDSLNSAFGKIEKSLEDTNTRITNLIGGESLNDAFDTLQEVSDWLAANDSGADKVIDDIAILKGGIDVNGSVLKSINDAITQEVTNRNNAISSAIGGLDVSDTPVDGQYVSGVSEIDGIISVSRTPLPTYHLTPGSADGTVALNGEDAAVTGLGSAAYTDSDSYASATILEDARFSFATSDTEDPGFTTLSLPELFTLVANLQAQVNNLTQEIKLLKNNNPIE